MNATIRKARPADLIELVRLCREHAAYENANYGDLQPDPDALAEMLFGGQPSLECLVVEVATKIIGYASYTVQYSTWRACRYLYLDCLFLQENSRGRGLGRAVMNQVRKHAEVRQCQHIEWQTPSDNVNAIAFYERIGAVAQSRARFFWPMLSGSGTAETRGGILPPPASLADPYRERPTRCTGVNLCGKWQLKTYEISRSGQPLPVEATAEALRSIQQNVVWPHETQERYGFLILNLGEQALWALAHFWVNDILRQYCFFAPLDGPFRFDVNPMPGFNACVWELKVTQHERDAWVRHVMADPGAPRFDQYLSDALTVPLPSASSSPKEVSHDSRSH